MKVRHNMLTFPDHTYLPFPILRVERICITIKLRSQEIIQVLNQAYMLHSYLQGDCKWRVSSDAENTLKNRLAQPPLLFHKQDRAVPCWEVLLFASVSGKSRTQNRFPSFQDNDLSLAPLDFMGKKLQNLSQMPEVAS